MPGCAGTVKWKKLTDNKWYLVCDETSGNVCTLAGLPCGCDNKGVWETDPGAAGAETPYCKCSADYECGYPLHWGDTEISHGHACFTAGEVKDTRADWNYCKTDCGAAWSMDTLGSDEYIKSEKVWTTQWTCTQCYGSRYVPTSVGQSECDESEGKSSYEVYSSVIQYSTYLPTSSSEKMGCNKNPGHGCMTMEKQTLQCGGSNWVKNAPACKPGQGMFDDAPGTVNPGTSSGN